MTEPIPDPKAVEAWMESLGFTWIEGTPTDPQNIWGHDDGTTGFYDMYASPQEAAFFYQALQNQNDALYEAMLEVIGPMYDYSECDNLPEGDRREMKLTMVGANGSKEKQLARLAAAFGKDKP